MFTRDCKIDADVERRVNAGNKVNGGIHAVVINHTAHNGVLVPTFMYGSECWVRQAKHESRITYTHNITLVIPEGLGRDVPNAVDIRSLRSMCGVTFNDRLRNEVIRDRCGVIDVVKTIKRVCLDGLVMLRG